MKFRARSPLVAAAMLALAGCGKLNPGGNAYVPAAGHFEPTRRDSRILIEGQGKDAELDELPVSIKGQTAFSHAYTYRGLAKSTATPATIMRLASNTKAWVDGALYNLITQKKVDPKAKVFAYLGITKPLPKGAKVDRRVYDITIEDMILHESGWDDSKPPHYDPTFKMREIALALHLKKAVGDVDYVRYQLGQPLQEPPGNDLTDGWAPPAQRGRKILFGL